MENFFLVKVSKAFSLCKMLSVLNKNKGEKGLAEKGQRGLALLALRWMVTGTEYFPTREVQERRVSLNPTLRPQSWLICS